LSTRQPAEEVGEWLTVDQAAGELGLSPSGFRGLAKTEGLEIRRRGGRPGVRRSDVDAYVERARILAARPAS
jgi:excisionase family DNA binding protein